MPSPAKVIPNDLVMLTRLNCALLLVRCVLSRSLLLVGILGRGLLGGSILGGSLRLSAALLSLLAEVLQHVVDLLRIEAVRIGECGACEGDTRTHCDGTSHQAGHDDLLHDVLQYLVQSHLMRICCCV